MCKDATSRAIKLAVEREGSLASVAAKLARHPRSGEPITRQAIEQWKRVPPRHVLALEAMSGVSRHELRPDIYGPPPKRVRPKNRAEARAA
jgi:DNA-binding transcriptional regulator YdaS (Cro superfamily)